MSLKLQIIIVVLVLLLLFALFKLVKDKKLELKYALVWIFVGIVILVMACFPVLMDYMAGFLGINSPPNMLFFLGFCLLSIILLSLTVAMSSTSVKVKKLAQRNALLEEELSQYRKISENKKEKE